ncbi:MAG: SRPBCC family protein, partial [Solirubrobacteraceae bacterium]
MASTTVEIARPPDEVFAFVTDPSKLSAWQDAEEVQQLTEGPVRAGTRFREVHKAMGRRRVELT